MSDKNSVFEKTYHHYLAQISRQQLKELEDVLGIQVKDNEAIIHVLGQPHNVSGNAIIGPSGQRPSLDICIILSKYILMCPDMSPPKKGWVSYRDFKDSGPLLTFYANDVERPVAEHFSGNLDKLKDACNLLNGSPPDIELAYDLCMQFDILPKIQLLFLFNDADKDFTASCSILFYNDAEKYLDAECLAMVGALLVSRLKRASVV